MEKEESQYFYLCGFSNETIARAAGEYLRTFHMVKDSGSRIFTKEECKFLGMDVTYFSEFVLVAPVWYRTFTNTIREISSAAETFESGWLAFDRWKAVKDEEEAAKKVAKKTKKSKQ